MADIKIKVDLQTSLKDMDKFRSTPGLTLSKQQQKSYDMNREGAIKALNSGDLKELRKYFNNMAEILKKASVASGMISKNLQDLTEKQKQINQNIQNLVEKRDQLKKSITSSRGFGTLSKTKANELLGDFADSGKILGKKGDQLKEASIINSRVQKLAQMLDTAGKTWSHVTDEMAQNAGFKNKDAALAAHRFYETEQKYIVNTQKEITNIDTQITNEQKTESGIAEEIEKIKSTSPEASKALSELYAEIVKLASATNTNITEEQSRQREQESNNQVGAGIDTTPLSGEIQKQTSSLGKAFKQFTIYNVALRAVKRALREAIATVKELDKELTEQAMVTGLTREQTYKLVKSYQDLAAQTGATTKEIAGVATEYMKQGKSIQESMILTEAAVSAAKVARVSTADSVNYLTTALNGFQLAAEDAMLVSDKFAAVAAASATDYDELAIALSKVASQANLAGMSIDYTTALLTKGLETTREAPETMGTALKTIIARMRELGDYGETLEGDTDINNVEKQLSYVGIALRNTEGELRSTEDVLDELGKKWDTLDKNQQAAVAKALAGTRQQSRLIAMMTDYERVTELQEIAQRSAGATAAQAGVYLEGIEASLNKITIGWEKIVASVTDSEAIISLLDFVGGMLDSIGDFLNTDFGLVATLTTIVGLTASALGNKMQEAMYSKIQAAEERQRQVIQLKTRQSELKALIAAKQQLILEKQKTNQDKQQLKFTTIEEKLKRNELTTAEADRARQQVELDAAKTELELEKELGDLKSEMISNEMTLTTLEQTSASTWSTIGTTVSMVAGGLGTLISGSSAWLAIMTAVGLAFKTIPPIIQTIRKIQAIKMAEEAAGETKSSLIKMAGAATGLGVPGLIIAAALMAMAGIAAIGGIIGGISKQKDSTEEKVNNLSNEIYKMNEKANAIDQITSSFDKLDNKIIKTKKDIEEMNSLLDQAADSLSDEEDSFAEGVSEKEHYQSLATDKQKREFLDLVEKQARDESKKLRQEQIKLFSNQELLNENTTDTNIKKAQSSLYANANAALYDYMDILKDTTDITDEAASATEELVESMIGELSLQQALDFNNNSKQIEDLVESVKDLKIEIDDSNISLAKVLTSDDYGITQKADAFNQLKKQLGEYTEEYQLLASAYSEYSVFANMAQDTLEMIDYLEISIEDINNLNEAWTTLSEKGLDISQEKYKELITSQGGILDTLAQTGGDVAETIDMVFGSYLSNVKDYEATYSALVKSFSDLIGIGMLNMGQNITKLKNTVSSFYEKASEWQELNDSEKMEFMNDNTKLFEGDNGEVLIKALESNDWKTIEAILSTSEEMQEDIATELKHIETELSLEQAKIESEQNKAYIRWLNERKAELENQTELFKADLNLLLEQEQAQLDIYKDYLEKQQEQLEESLEKRKEAYEKYFEAINQQYEDNEYQEESDKLVANLAKLSTSTDASSQKQAKELEQQLKDLEEERQRTLRERAQEAVIEGISQELDNISSKFDDLLENERELLKVMQGEYHNSDFLASLLSSAKQEGMTDLQLEQFANEINSAFGSSVDTSNIQEIMEQIQNNATINIGDQTIDLDSVDGNAVWETIAAMLVKYGYR